jgi:L-Ala-D/L-Glu epimerase
VEASGTDGLIGYGEACPRTYVTGETMDSCRAAFERWRPDVLRNIASVSALRAWVFDEAAEINYAPAAWCAIELALLDLAARQLNSNLESLLCLPPAAQRFRFTAVLGDQDEQTFATQLRQYRKWGFEQFKIKLGPDRTSNLRKCELLAQAGVSRANARADANNLWRDSSEAIEQFAPLAPSFSALEEPLAPGDFAGLQTLARACDVAIVLDESFLRLEHLANLRPHPATYILNLRISKLGGLIRSLEIVHAAAEQGIPVIVGAQVGETSVLTRAALTLASAAGENLLAQEGAFGTHLLSADVTDPPLMFGPKGEISLQTAAPLPIVRPTGFLQP